MVAGMRLATWNVNSLGARQDRVEQWLTSVRPDVLCMQETKLADDAVPALAFEALGYHVVHHGQGRWNGVAVLSRSDPCDVVYGFVPGIDEDRDARLVTPRCDGVLVVSVYVPNGRSLDDEHYEYKLSWLDRLYRHIDALSTPDDDLIVMGDWNVAPSDDDVYDVSAFVDSTHVSAAERRAIEQLREWGLEDPFRARYPEAGIFSWWDYRAGNFHKRKGLRIDYALTSASVARRTTFALIDRNARKGTLPSDHAPVVFDLAPRGG